MIVTCPECHRRYRIPLASLGEKGRTVRCSACSHLWHVEPFGMASSTQAPTLLVEPQPEIREVRDEPLRFEPASAPAPEKPVRNGGHLATAAGWLVLTGLSGLVLVGLMGRDLVIERWPEALAFYQRLGLPVILPLKLELADVATSRDGPTPLAALEVTGTIRNVADQPRLLPQLRLALHDDKQNEIDFLLFDPPQAELAPGGSTPFALKVQAPPATAMNVSVTFGDTP